MNTEVKICKRCNEEKPLSEYYFIKPKQGNPYPQNLCKNCRIIYNKERKEIKGDSTADGRSRPIPCIKICKHCNVEKPINEFRPRKERNNRPASICRKCESLKARGWQLKNPEKVKENWDTFYLENKDSLTEKRKSPQGKLYDKEYRQTHKPQIRAHCSKRRALKKTQMPKWANEKYIRLWFTHSKLEEERTGMKCHIDHIVPLKGKIKGIHVVCGLHCEDNLQVMFAKDNLKKWCNTWPDMS